MFAEVVEFVRLALVGNAQALASTWLLLVSIIGLITFWSTLHYNGNDWIARAVLPVFIHATIYYLTTFVLRGMGVTVGEPKHITETITLWSTALRFQTFFTLIGIWAVPHLVRRWAVDAGQSS